MTHFKKKPIQGLLFLQYYKYLNTFSVKFQYSLTLFPQAHVAADNHNTLCCTTAKIISHVMETHIQCNLNFLNIAIYFWEFLLNSDVNLFAPESCHFYHLLWSSLQKKKSKYLFLFFFLFFLNLVLKGLCKIMPVFCLLSCSKLC